ncbi:AraC family transcriptional regulator [Pedobacter nyackensis]|uniref:Transcriptional regulator, AraC family n=1 Tax=Pedobacter nyackensis TaxID=475255 RepID=A0A1W2F2F5_9SPHI|nr:AraC family transcriptional regulator [Pedobacter nyackensis]SMD16091.1 transcriptional regulator, AraC family [Pedobacter nyackensis]
MKPLHLKVPAYSKFYIDARREQVRYFANPWHFHDELEITFVINSEGTKFIGDHISEFKPGEIILLGSRLPHYWRNHNSYYQNTEEKGAEAIIIRFNQDYAGSEFLSIPPMKPVFDLLNDAKRGICIAGHNEDLQQKLISFLTLDEGQKTIALTEILFSIATQKPYDYLCSIGYAHQYKSNDIEKIDTVYNYVLNNFKSDLSLKDIALRCNMNTAAFCRYFKKKTGKTFKDFMNEIRLGNAAKLLLKGDLTIAEVAFESGFNNPSYFNRLFKRMKGTTPKAYQLQYLNTN